MGKPTGDAGAVSLPNQAGMQGQMSAGVPQVSASPQIPHFNSLPAGQAGLQSPGLPPQQSNAMNAADRQKMALQMVAQALQSYGRGGQQGQSPRPVGLY